VQIRIRREVSISIHLTSLSANSTYRNRSFISVVSDSSYVVSPEDCTNHEAQEVLKSPFQIQNIFELGKVTAAFVLGDSLAIFQGAGVDTDISFDKK